MAKGWIIIYKCNNINTAEIIKSLLEDNDIPSIIVNKMDSMHLHLMNGDIEVHVKENDAMNAKHIITKNID